MEPREVAELLHRICALTRLHVGRDVAVHAQVSPEAVRVTLRRGREVLTRGTPAEVIAYITAPRWTRRGEREA